MIYFTFDSVNLCKLVLFNQCNYIPKTHLLSIFPHFRTHYYQQFNTLRIQLQSLSFILTISKLNSLNKT